MHRERWRCLPPPVSSSPRDERGSLRHQCQRRTPPPAAVIGTFSDKKYNHTKQGSALNAALYMNARPLLGNNGSKSNTNNGTVHKNVSEDTTNHDTLASKLPSCSAMDVGTYRSTFLETSTASRRLVRHATTPIISRQSCHAPMDDSA